MARYAYDKLQQLRIPPSWSDQLDLAALSIRSKPFSDKDDLMPVSWTIMYLLRADLTSADMLQMLFQQSFNIFPWLCMLKL